MKEQKNQFYGDVNTPHHDKNFKHKTNQNFYKLSIK